MVEMAALLVLQKKVGGLLLGGRGRLTSVAQVPCLGVAVAATHDHEGHSTTSEGLTSDDMSSLVRV